MIKIVLLVLIQLACYFSTQIQSEKVKVISIATEKTDGFKRFERSLKAFNYDYEIYGLGEEWRGGNIAQTSGGGQKINILKRELEKFKNDKETILIFTDSYDVIANDDASQAVEKFKSFKTRVLFSAEETCWPDPTLSDDYPLVGLNEKRFLNSGGIMAYAADLYEIITMSPVKDQDDDQLYYTKLYLKSEIREKYNIKLDTKSTIFQNLNGALNEISLVTMGDELVVYNNKTETLPIFIHGNGPIKMYLNRLGNYIGKAYSITEGCKICNDEKIKLEEDVNNDNYMDKWPEVTMALFIEVPTPFIREFFQKISDLNYPKKKISVLIHNNVKYHSSQIEEFFTNPKNDYKSIKYISPEEDSPEYEARSEAIDECKKSKCDYYFTVDSTVHLDNPETLKFLIEQNKDIIAPVLLRKETTWSNVWGAVSTKGYYLRSEDYLDIIYRTTLGCWNLPYITDVILMKSDLFKRINIIYEDPDLDSSLKFAENLRNKDIFMYATNTQYFGHLINPESFNTSIIRPEMYEIFSNYDDWMNRYLHENYSIYLESEDKYLQPCPDVYWFPVVTDEFCDDLIVMTEHFGQWSGGRNNNYDPRLPGGYENVPTVDIHMRQLDWDKHWLFFVKKVILPIQQKIFTGYFHDPPESLLNFVVRYKPGEQDSLKPHHDASTYTINIALNKPKIDFEGGGCRFVRYNCSVLETRKGWTFIHPGRLTHYHEGLKVTNGTRYIMVSFIDP